MPKQIEVTVGRDGGQFSGSDHLVLQAAVDYVTRLGGGTVRILPGEYEMGNSLFLRSGLTLVGSGEDTILRKRPSEVTKLTDDTDWYDWRVTVEDASIFEVGGAILLRGKCPHSGQGKFVKRTVRAIEGDVIHIDKDPRENFWIDTEAEAATLFPVVTGDYVDDITIESLTIDGNLEQNENLNGNYGGGIFIQDCSRIVIRDVTTQNNNSDGMSWQVCHDVTVENCRSINDSDLGLHAGSGSHRSVVRHNSIRGASQGFFFCWGVKHGLVEDNVIEDCDLYGISIGHRDTDNIVRNNVVRRSGKHGIFFREHPVALRDPHRNTFERNVIEDSGSEGDCVAIEMLGAAEDVVLAGNRVIDTRGAGGGLKRIGIRVGAKIERLTLDKNKFAGMDEEIVDLRD